MKSRFTTIDIRVALNEISKSDAIGLRLANVYDIDNKTYLLRVVHGDKKIVILIESGNRLHLTEYDWPKNMLPSAFAMKCRKHLKGRRLASVKQLGIDRIVDFQFGYDEAAYHLIVELYDRGNIILTDYQYTILQLLRMRTDNDKDVRFAVHEQYPWNLARSHEPLLKEEELIEKLKSAKVGEQLKRLLNPMFVYGPALLDHSLMEVELKPTSKLGSQFDIDNNEDIKKLMKALEIAENFLLRTSTELFKGYIIQKKEALSKQDDKEEFTSYVEFHPMLFNQHKNQPFVETISFNKAVDEFFSKLETQKIDMKALQKEKAALKRLENVKLDHEKRIQSLQTSQDEDMKKAELIELNLPLVDRAILTINSAIANQIDWEEIEEIVQEAKDQNDPVAKSIKSLNLKINKINLLLFDQFAESSESESDDDYDDDEIDDHVKRKNKKNKDNILNVEIDLGLTAFANARNYHNKRRNAASKEMKTMQASKKALKSAEKKTQETLKEVQTSTIINKTRKTYWFEKFYWFISSENYLVIGGRDQQQNELIVKRYLKPGDLYVHADLHGASSVILKNPGGGEVPPKTLNEAGTMAICYSAAWEARVITSAWWVYHNQVSKTAPSGEYLTTGSFMIRGKKNYLPPSYLVMGFSLMFKLDESSIENHLNDRKIRIIEDDTASKVTEEEEEIKLEELDDDIDENENTEKSPIKKSENIDSLPTVTGKNNPISDQEDKCNEKIEGLNSFDGLNIENFGEKGVNKPDVSEIKDDIDSNCRTETSIRDTDNEANEENDTNRVHNLSQRSTKSENIDNDVNENEDEDYYPDTNIQLQYVSGGVYQLQRGLSTGYSNNNESNIEPTEEDQYIYLGDNEKVSVYKQEPVNRKPRLSSKQKRDLKKKKKQNAIEDGNEEVVNDNQIKSEVKSNSNKSGSNAKPKENVTQQPLKRGQKSKQKRMKEKYKDQDDEDRELMQQILMANGPEKPPKKKGKEKQKEKEQNKQQNKQNKKKNNANPNSTPVPEILHNPDVTPSKEHAIQENPDEDDDGPDDIDKENITLLDSLTGSPSEDDVLLYAVPICAPYTCMQNYKFKVKLTPGTGKRGKAAKTAVHMFQMAKETTEWEKDLMKCLKDDISRNIPGKVKVSAPNLQKVKKK